MARDVVEAAAAAAAANDRLHHHQHKAAVVAAENGGGAAAAALVWDCGSELYDSYELTSFRRQLDAAVLSCRSLSMPHLSSPASTQQQQLPAGRRRRKRGRRLPAMLRRLFGKVLLRLRLPAAAAAAARGGWYDYGAHGDGRPGSPWSGALTSIPEESASSPENGRPPSSASPAGGVIRRAQSERFVGSKTASSMVQFDVVL